jgi:hypothetical protein
MRAHEDYFDEDGKQTDALPSAWIALARRFQPGDRIRYLGHQSIYVGPTPAPAGDIPPEHFRDLHGEIGEVLKVTDGRRVYPDQRWSEEHECWVTDRRGWLTVRFPFDCYGVEKDGTTPKPRACHPDEEGITWERIAPERSTT